MKRNILFFLFLLSAVILSAQKGKRVYITLDVSGSMTGNKYALANYTTQMIVTLCGEDDEVSMIVYGIEKKLSGEQNPLQIIQKPMSHLRFGNPRSSVSQFDDIMGFNAVYSPSREKQDWLFIIGDGQWSTQSNGYKADRETFSHTIEQGNLNVCYLQTGENLNESSDFTDYVEDFGVVDICKSSTDPKTIQDGCDHFARKILGFSETTLDIHKDGDNSIRLMAELPLQEFLLVYQDEVAPRHLPKIRVAQYDGTSLNVRHKGTPTTIPVGQNAVKLSGNVWHIKGGSTIPARTEITIEFDKNVDTKKIRVYPLVKDVRFGSMGFTRVGEGLKQLDDKTFSICRDEKNAVVRIELDKNCKTSIPEELVEKTKVVVKANGKDYPAKFKDGGFECTIDLKDDETPYYAECDCPGYFKRVTPITTIVKGDCGPVEPPTPPVVRQDAVDFGAISFEQLQKGSIKGVIKDSESLETLDPNKFDLSVEMSDGFLYEDPAVSIQGDTIAIDVRPRGDWCECLFPNDLNLTVVSTPKPGAFVAADKSYVRAEHPIHLQIQKGRPWMARCFWAIMTLIALLLLCFYLRALLKKNRFHKRARLKNLYYVDDEPKEIEKSGHPLRRPGFSAWCDRWLNPFGDEKRTVSFIRPRTKAITFMASPSKMRILMSGASFDASSMVVPNYTPKDKGKKDTKNNEPIIISSGTSIEIKRTQAGETTRLGHLRFIVQGKDDEGGYRFFVGLLLFLAVVGIIALTVLLIRSFI